MRLRIFKSPTFKILALVIFIYSIFALYNSDDVESRIYLPKYKPRDDHKAFITSSYFYPKSKSLGDNSLALVMSFSGSARRKEWMNLEQWDELNTPLITVKAENSTSSIVVRTKYKRITPHEQCQLISIFATVQLLPNVQRISMLGDDGGQVEIPFQLPATTPHDVVICINPVFLADQWQNFIFMAHLYKQFDGFVNLYFISAIDSIYSLMREYEKEGYLKIQLWPSVKFQGVPRSVLDPYNQVESENRASANTDCLLQYKESAEFVTFLDMHDLLIPTRGPTFLKEFQNSVWSWRNVQYLHYQKEDYEMLTLRSSRKLSFRKMFKSLKNKKIFRTGQIVANPKLMNYTWMHGPSYIPRGLKYILASGRSLTHVKLKWLAKYNITDQPRLYNISLSNFMGSETVEKIELDVSRMMTKPEISKIVLPTYHHFTDAISRCFFHNPVHASDPKCPRSHLCQIEQIASINCVHVNATYPKTPTLRPISFYYATDLDVMYEQGCHPPH